MALSADELADRYVGVVLASAAGDALGAPYEFGPPLPESVTPAMTGGGSLGWAPGEWTDDTQMALAILSPLAAGDRSVEAVEAGFLAWGRSRPRDVGNQTRAVLAAGPPLRGAAEAHRSRQPGNAAGNGGLMRVGPAVFRAPGDPTVVAAYASAVTALTHVDETCLDAGVLWACAIDRTAREPNTGGWDLAATLHDALAWLPADRRDPWRIRIDEAVAQPPAAFPNNGWVVDAFRAAVSVMVRATAAGGPPGGQLRRALEAAVRVGGDTDTVAAIAGALLGARWGASALPAEWRRVLHGQRVYGEPPLDADGLETLAREALQHTR